MKNLGPLRYRSSAAFVGVLLGLTTAHAQEDGFDSTRSPVPVSARLLILKARWTDLADGQRITDEIREMLVDHDEDEPAADYLPKILLHSGNRVALYERDTFLRLARWLKSQKIIVSSAPFENGRHSTGVKQVPVPPSLLPKSEGLFRRYLRWSWSVRSNGSQTTLRRTLTEHEQYRDQPPKLTTRDAGAVSFLWATKGVAIHRAFPLERDSFIRRHLSDKQILPFVVMWPASESDPFDAINEDAEVVHSPPLSDGVVDHVETRFANNLEAWRNEEFARVFVGQSQEDTAAPPQKLPRYVAGEEVMVSWSTSEGIAWGYSKQTGKWTPVKIGPAKLEPPIVSAKVAAIHSGNSIFAFSSSTGQWDELALERRVQSAVTDDVVIVETADDVYVFADTTGKWTSPSGTDLRGTRSSNANDEFRPTNRAPDTRISRSEDQLRKQFKRYDNEARELAAQLRDLRGRLKPGAARLRETEKQLHDAVNQAFEAKLLLQRRRVEVLRARLQQIESSVERRTLDREKSVERRVQQLLDD